MMKNFTVMTLTLALSLSFGLGLYTLDAQAQDELTEIKVNVKPSDLMRVLRLAQIAPSDREDLQVNFFDDHRLSAYQAGLILRTRHNEDQGEITIKARPADASKFRKSLREKNGFKCEEDQSASRSVYSCSLTLAREAHQIRSAQQDRRKIEKLLSDKIEDFIQDSQLFFPDADRLQFYGPIQSNKWKGRNFANRFQRINIEIWTLPSGEKNLEISTRVPSDISAQELAFLTSTLRRNSITVVQGANKTAWALSALKKQAD